MKEGVEMKKMIVVVIGIILLSVSILAAVYLRKDSYKIDKIQTYAEFSKYADNLQVRLDDTDPERLPEIKENVFEQLESSHFSNDCVLEITAQDTYMQKGNMNIQDAVVNNVLEGETALEGQKIYISKSGGIVVKGKANTVCIDTQTCVNVMLPGERYLVFCAKSQVSDILDDDAPIYELSPIKFGLLRIAEDDTKPVVSGDQLDGKYYVNYNDYEKQEFFVISDATLQGYLEIKHEIFKKYGVE